MGLPPAAQQIADRADAETGSRLSQAVEMQEAYRVQHGRYWQGMPTQSQAPKDGEQGNPDYSRRPSDQPHDWNTSGAASVMPSPPNTRVQVDVYDCPRGKGWVLRMDFRVGNARFAKAVNTGPESQLSHEWMEVVE